MKKNSGDVKPRRQNERASRRAGIVEAAEKIFCRKGFERASMDEIAAEAQFTKRTVYMYFVNKEDLLFAAALEGNRRLFARQRAALAEGDSGLARIRGAALAYYRFSREFPDLFRLMEDARHVKSREKIGPNRLEFQHYRAFMFEEYAKAFQAGMADGSLRRDLDPKRLVYAVVLILAGFVQALSDAALPDTSEPDPDAFARFALDLIADALRAKA